MKYWIFQSNQVNGPYDADDLSQLPGFSAEALVCPEGRKGTNMGDWQRAGMLPELSVALLKASQLSASAVGGGARGGGGIYGSLPPEPTLKDLAALGSLQEKLSVMENALGQLQDGLRRKDNELLSLHRELEDKKRGEQELASKLGGLEERLTSVSKMRANLDEAIADERKVESSVRDVESTVKGMEETVEKQRRTIDELMRDLEALREARIADHDKLAGLEKARAVLPRAAAPVALERPAPAMERSFDLAPPPSLEPAPLFPAPSESLVPGLSAPPMPMVPPSDGLSVPAPPPLPGTLRPTATPFDLSGTAADLSSAPAPFAESPAPAPAKSKKGLVMAAAALAVLGGGGFAAMQMGLLGGKTAPAVEESPLPAPAPAPAPEPVAAETQVEEQKQQAIGLARMWPSGDGAMTVGQRLETEAAAPGLSPWMAERLADGLFQVNFYAKSAGPGGQTIYEFQVRPAQKQVSALNRAAKALLESAPPAAPAPKPRKVKVRPKAAEESQPSNALDSPLGLSSGEPPARREPAPESEPEPEPEAETPKPAPRRAAKPARKAQPKSDESLDELLVPGSAEAKRSEASATRLPPAPKVKRPVKEADDADLLDELLKP